MLCCEEMTSVARGILVRCPLRSFTSPGHHWIHKFSWSINDEIIKARDPQKNWPEERYDPTQTHGRSQQAALLCWLSGPRNDR